MEVQEWNARMSSLHAVQIALGGESGTTTAAGRLSTSEEEKQEQGKAAGYFQGTGPSGGPGFRREPTRRGLLHRLGQSSNAHKAEGPFDGGERMIFPSALVLWRTKIALMMIPWVSPISGGI